MRYSWLSGYSWPSISASSSLDDRSRPNGFSTITCRGKGTVGGGSRGRAGRHRVVRQIHEEGCGKDSWLRALAVGQGPAARALQGRLATGAWGGGMPSMRRLRPACSRERLRLRLR